MARRRAQAARRDARRRPLRNHGRGNTGSPGAGKPTFGSMGPERRGFGDDNDLEWISYLTGGRTVAPKPYEEDEPQRRSSGRKERATFSPRQGQVGSDRPRTGSQSGSPGAGAAADQRPVPGAARSIAQRPGGPGGDDRPRAWPHRGQGSRVWASRRTDRPASGVEIPARSGRRRWPGPRGRPWLRRPAAAEPRHDLPAAAGWPATADSGYQLPTLADTQYGQSTVAADPQFDQAPPLPDQQYGHAPQAPDQQYGHTTAVATSSTAKRRR